MCDPGGSQTNAFRTPSHCSLTHHGAGTLASLQTDCGALLGRGRPDRGLGRRGLHGRRGTRIAVHRQRDLHHLAPGKRRKRGNNGCGSSRPRAPPPPSIHCQREQRTTLTLDGGTAARSSPPCLAHCIRHQGYDSINNLHDIAVIELDRPAASSSVIAMDTRAAAELCEPAGAAPAGCEQVTIVGFGSTTYRAYS